MREPYLELVRRDSGWLTRVRGANGHKVFQSEIYTRKAAALNAFRVLGDMFGSSKAHVTGYYLSVPTFDDVNSGGWLAIPIREVDERGSR